MQVRQLSADAIVDAVQFVQLGGAVRLRIEGMWARAAATKLSSRLTLS